MFMVKSIPVQGNIFLPDGSEYLCPVCKEGTLIFRDYCKRIVRHDDGERETFHIPRHKCSNPRCGKLHRMLPDFMVPFKHYTEDVISDCVNNSSEQSQICDGPSTSTIDRWKRWISLNTTDINGHLAFFTMGAVFTTAAWKGCAD